ncbi:MAG: N-formylglutamate amidohydrolase [Nitratireductor sp.]
MFEPVEIIDGDYSKGLVLLCDHASNALPKEYGDLGIGVGEFERHIAYDIGARALTVGLARVLGVPAVLSCFSRLLIDPNRGFDDPTLVRQLSDGTIIPSNYPLSSEELLKRQTQFYAPYRGAIDAALQKVRATSTIPAVFSVHSMTHKWNETLRPWEVALLWDKDPRMVTPLFQILGQQHAHLTVGDNQPYDGALIGDTMYSHCTMNGYAHALLEVRQDLLSKPEDIEGWVNIFAPMLEKVNAMPDIHEVRKYGSRTGLASE